MKESGSTDVNRSSDQTALEKAAGLSVWTESVSHTYLDNSQQSVMDIF